VGPAEKAADFNGRFLFAVSPRVGVNWLRLLRRYRSSFWWKEFKHTKIWEALKNGN